MQEIVWWRVQTDVGNQAVTYKLMRPAQEMKTEGSSDIHLIHFEKAYFSEGKTYGGLILLVCVHGINHEM